jgi:hypothetical protein
MAELPIVIRPAVAHGWLRRPEMDTEAGNVWELPDGKLVRVERGHRPLASFAPRLTEADHEYLAWRAAKRRGGG